jgi:Bacterial Ig-like domain (group 3)
MPVNSEILQLKGAPMFLRTLRRVFTPTSPRVHGRKRQPLHGRLLLEQFEKRAVPASGQLDTPMLEFISATETSITLNVCAGASGAPAGFSLFWMPAAELAAGGDGIVGTDDDGLWSDSLDLCSASFSGVLGASRFALSAGECTPVTPGNFVIDDIGFSSECLGPLECGTDYAFRVFAHAEPGRGGLGRSDFSDTFEFATADCPAATTTTLLASALNPSTYGDSIDFTATVSSSGGTPTGSIQFFIDDVAFGAAATLDGTGSAISDSIATLGAGGHSVKAVFTPNNGDFSGSESTLTQQVNKADAIFAINDYHGTYDGLAHGLTGSATGVFGEDLSGLLDLGAQHTNAGSYTVSWTFAGSDNYNEADGNGSVVITPKLLDALANMQASLNAAKAGVVPFNITVDSSGIIDGQSVYELFNGAHFTISFANNAGTVTYDFYTEATVNSDGTIHLSLAMNATLQSDLLTTLDSLGSTTDFSITGTSNDGNYAIDTRAFARVFSAGKP